MDEYEKILEERRANLNKVTPKKPYKVDEKEFKGLKIHTKKDVEEDVVLELTNKKAIGARKAGIVDKTLKEVCTAENNFFFPLFFPLFRNSFYGCLNVAGTADGAVRATAINSRCCKSAHFSTLLNGY